MESQRSMLDLAIAGCGDVWFRTYAPALATDLESGRARVVVCFDPQPERAARAAALFPGARAVTDLADLLATGAHAALNLTPAPFHFATNRALLEAGLHVLSEKPIAGSVPEARALLALAEGQRRLLLVAPAILATNRFRWLKEEIARGRIGTPTLAVAQQANMGPAAWRDYTGDPTVHYQAGVGPMLDTGVYVLHAVTGLLGPARHVQARGRIAIPRRTIQCEAMRGRQIEVTTNDHMLIQLDCDGALAQVISSFATPATKAPVLEIHGALGSISIGQEGWYDANGPADVFVRDESGQGSDGWRRESPPEPSPHRDIIGCGVPHFIACIRGEETPIMTAAHATHVLEIILKATEAATSGATLPLETGF